MSEEKTGRTEQQYGTGEEYTYHRTESNRVGVTMSAGVDGNTVAELMEGKPGVEVHKFPAMIRIEGERSLEFDLNEIAEAMGVEDYSPYDFEIEMSSHYGRMVRDDDRVMLFADPADAAEELGFDLPKQQ